MLCAIILGALTVLSLALTLWQLEEARRFPLHHRASPLGKPPAVTLLKPLKGCDAETIDCLKSWFTQDYNAPVQILFGVAAANDPVCDPVRQLINAFPQREAQLLICPEELGPNAKVSTLIQLQRQARHDRIIVSDADVWVPADFLGQVVRPLEDGQVGLVNCFYRMASCFNTAMRWEAFTVNADFWSQVLQAVRLKPMDFALGAVMATTRRHLAMIGGFEAVAHYLADDYRLGRLVAGSGARLALCPVVVECRSAAAGWREVWAHQVRWARTIRVCQPAPYFLSLLSNATLWPLLWLLWQPTHWSLAIAGLCCLARSGTGFFCEGKLTGTFRPSSLVLGVWKDLLQIPVWLLAFAGNRITWRGRRFEVQASGKLVRVE